MGMKVRLACVIAGIAGASLWAGAQSASVPERGSVAEQYLFAAANMERVQRGLPQLAWDEALSKAAIFHAQQMVVHGGISHRFAGEPDLLDRGSLAGAKFSKIAENLAEASSAVTIHDLWMHSKGHRENLLDAEVDRVAIAVVSRGGQLFAVEDFVRGVQTMSFDEQERVVHGLLAPFGLRVVEGSDEARKTCSMDSGFAGEAKPMFVMRFSTRDLTQLPEALKEKMRSGRYHEAAIGACPVSGNGKFSGYNVAVLLYP
jgi:hypothetical protein